MSVSADSLWELEIVLKNIAFKDSSPLHSTIFHVSPQDKDLFCSYCGIAVNRLQNVEIMFDVFLYRMECFVELQGKLIVQWNEEGNGKTISSLSQDLFFHFYHTVGPLTQECVQSVWEDYEIVDNKILLGQAFYESLVFFCDEQWNCLD